MEALFEKKYNPPNEIELPLEVLKDEENFKYFSGTEKYGQKYTENIVPFMNEESAIIGRLFLDKNKEAKYVEIFRNKKMDILGISEKITFLHTYIKDKKEHYNSDKFIGFRYYEKNLNDKKEPCTCGNYFTLVRKNYSKYFILEKNDSIKDIKGNIFYDENLNCHQIIKKIIFEKYRNKIIGDGGDIFPEIIGYCFALIYSNKNENIIFLEPLIAHLETKFCLEESITKVTKENIIYIEPFIYDGHISTIISDFQDTRYNILLDMSHHHFKRNYAFFSFLPESVKNAINYILPEKDIQAYSTCCLWFIGIIECLLKYKKYSTFKDIYMALRKDNINFYIEVINLLYKEIEGKDDLIKRVSEEEKEFIANRIDFDRYPLFDGKNYYEFHKDIIFNKFLDIEKFIRLNTFIYPTQKQIFFLTQSYIDRIHEFKNKLILNLRYYEMLPESENDKKTISETLIKIDKQIDYFKNKYDYAFYYFNMFFYCVYIKPLLDEITNPYSFKDEEKKEILNFDFAYFMSNVTNDCSRIIEKTQRNVVIYSPETIARELNSMNELCYNLMNK